MDIDKPERRNIDNLKLKAIKYIKLAHQNDLRSLPKFGIKHSLEFELKCFIVLDQGLSHERPKQT